MLRLDLSPPVPRWIDLLPGVRLQVRPMTGAIWAAAQHAAAAAGGDEADGVARTVLRAAELAILAWEGVGDETGTPIPPSPGAIGALLARRDGWEAFNRLYLDPWYEVQAEKKGSAPSPGGISAGAPATAAPAAGPAPAAPAALTPPPALKAG